MSPPPSPLMLLPLLLVLAAGSFSAANAKTTPPFATAAADAGAPPPVPTPWPEQFHAVVIINRTESGGRLRQIDIYYDWPNGRSLNIMHDQLSGEPFWDIQWVNGTEYFFDAASCRTFQYDVGVLPPDWKARGAAYLGRERVDGFDCHVWSNFVFPRYYDDVATGRPVAWINSVMQWQHVLSFEEGSVIQDTSKWQAPAYCFNGDNADIANVAADEVDVVKSLIRFAGAPAAAIAASSDQ